MHGLIDYEDTLISGPTIEPIDLDEVKKALRFTATSEDTLIDGWISAARQYFEQESGRAAIDTLRERWLDVFPCQREIELPYPPLLDVVSVKYDDGNGDEQTLDPETYLVRAPAGPLCGRGRIALVSGASWPSTAGHAKAVRIRFRCGYGSATGDVPELAKSVLYMLVAHFHRFRSATTETAVSQVPLGVDMILKTFKYTALSALAPRGSW